MRIRYGAGTDKGRVRDRNEDNNMIIDCGSGNMLFAVADGMGGMDFGDIASTMAVDKLASEFRGCELPADPDEITKRFREIYNSVNIEIINECIRKKSVSGMGTTLSACLIYGSGMAVAHMGDSRIYLFRDGEIKQLTKDHSYVEELIDCGRITREQARIHPNRNIITRALGLDREIEVDISFISLQAGDRILLCTDGLTNAVEDDELAGVISRGGEPGDAVGTLIGIANDRGGRDNITVQLVYIEE